MTAFNERALNLQPQNGLMYTHHSTEAVATAVNRGSVVGLRDVVAFVEFGRYRSRTVIAYGSA